MIQRKWAGLIVVVSMAFTSCENQQEKAARLAAEAKDAEQRRVASEASAKRERAQAIAAAEQAKANKAAKKALIERMKPLFVREKDKFDGVITWRYKAYSRYFNTNGRGIVAKIVDNHLECYSAYVADDWIFHTSFTVKIGGEQKTFSGKVQHEVVSGIAECVNLDGSDSEELAKFIADSNPKEPVLMRFLGKYYKDITLSQSHRKAITDTWRFFNAMK